VAERRWTPVSAWGGLAGGGGTLAALLHGQRGLPYIAYIVLFAISVIAFLQGVWLVLRPKTLILIRRQRPLQPTVGWRQARTSEVRVLAEHMRASLARRGHRSSSTLGDELQFYVKIGIRTPCPPLPRLMPTSDVVAGRFLQLLQSGAIEAFLSALDYRGDDISWRSAGAQGRARHNAILTGAGSKDNPIAWVQIQIPDSRSSNFKQAARFAELIASVDLCANRSSIAPSADLTTWQGRLYQVFALAEAFTTFLLSDSTLGLVVEPTQVTSATPSEPNTQIGVWVRARSDITELVTKAGVSFAEGSQPVTAFSAYAVSDSPGETPEAIAQAWMIRMCEKTLRLQHFEHILASVPSFADSMIEPRTDRQRAVNRRTLLVRVGGSAVSLSAGIVIDQVFFQGRVIKEYVYPPEPSPSPHPLR
jgi:hypothetical protein